MDGGQYLARRGQILSPPDSIWGGQYLARLVVPNTVPPQIVSGGTVFGGDSIWHDTGAGIGTGTKYRDIPKYFSRTFFRVLFVAFEKMANYIKKHDSFFNTKKIIFVQKFDQRATLKPTQPVTKSEHSGSSKHTLTLVR